MTISYSLFTRQLFALLLFTLTTGIIIGWYGFALFGDVAALVEIKYAAVDEIMQLEKDRIKETNLTTIDTHLEENQIIAPQLFFGKAEQAANLSINIATEHNNKTTKVIYSSSPIYSTQATSISKQVHEEILRRLK